MTRLGSQFDFRGKLLDHPLDRATEVGLVARVGFGRFPDPARNVRPEGFSDIKGTLEIFKPYAAGLKDIAGFSHLVVIFAFHQARGQKLRVRPPFQKDWRGVFATRSPRRPNPVGMTVVKLLGRKKNLLQVAGVDMIEGTPILDIKPYTAGDGKRGAKYGWQERRTNKA